MFYLFGGDCDLTHVGGWNDFVDEHASVDDALAQAEDNQYDWYHIVDASSLSIVVRS